MVFNAVNFLSMPLCTSVVLSIKLLHVYLPPWLGLRSGFAFGAALCLSAGHPLDNRLQHDCIEAYRET